VSERFLLSGCRLWLLLAEPFDLILEMRVGIGQHIRLMHERQETRSERDEQMRLVRAEITEGVEELGGHGFQKRVYSLLCLKPGKLVFIFFSNFLTRP